MKQSQRTGFRLPEPGQPALAPVFELRNAFLFLVALALGTISVVCLKAPRAPSWDTTVTLPLIEKTYRLMDVLPHNYFSVGDDSVIQFQAAANIDTIRPISNVTLSGRPFQTSFRLSELTLSGDFSSRIKLGLEEVLGMPLPDQPTLMPVPPFHFTIQRSFAVSRIRTADVLRGTAVVHVHNCAEVGIDSVRLVSDLLGRMRFTGIGPDCSPQNRHSLGGARILEQNQFVLSGASRGTSPESAWVSKNDSIVIEVEMDSLRLTSAEAQIPDARSDKKLYLGVAVSHAFVLDSVQFARGYAQIAFANGFNFPLDVALSVARLGYRENVHLDPGAARNATIDLAGQALASNGLTNSLLEVLTKVTVPADPDFIRISKDQALSVNSALSDLTPNYLRGELREPLYITPPQETLPSLLPSGLPALRLPRCVLTVNATSAIGFAGHLNLHITGTNQAGDTARIDKTIYLEPGNLTFPRTTQVAIPLYHVLTIGPEHLGLTYDIGMTGYGSVEAGGYACGRASIATPLRLAFCADTINLGGKVVEIDQGLRDNIARYLVAGEIQADVGNHFPLGMHACVVLKPEPPDTIRATDTLAIPVGIPAGAVDANQTCNRQTDTTVVGAIDEQSLAIFHNRRIRAQLYLFMPQTDTVTIRNQDFLTFSSRAVLKLRLGGNHEN